ncbi:MFS general substrate transporter [Xylariaceae sp. FL0662B]|nr:MFS general substrate transporter [Xylariaceae sp. FL0662B]
MKARCDGQVEGDIAFSIKPSSFHPLPDMAFIKDEKPYKPAVSVTAVHNSELSVSSDEPVAPAVPDTHEDEYPDGGAVAWRQVIAGHLINVIASGFTSAFGIYQLYYTETLHLPASQVSWIGSIQIFLYNLICTPAGRISDAGYARESVMAGSFFAVLGTFMTSLATEYWQIFLAQGVCTGLGLSLMFMPTVTILTSYFQKKRSLVLAISSAGSGTGGIIFPATVQYLIPRIGFSWAVRCACLVTLFIVTLVFLLIKPRHTRRSSSTMVDWAAFRDPPYTLYVVGAFLFWWALYFGFFYINTYAATVASFTPTSAVSLLLIMNAVGIPFRPLVGYLADAYLGPVNAFILMIVAVACTFLVWIAITTPAAMYGFAVLFGVMSSAAQGASAGALASLSRDPAKMGTRYGMCCTIVGFATVAGGPTAGAIIEYCGGKYLWAQVWAGLVTLLGAVTLTMGRWWITGPRFKVKV